MARWGAEPPTEVQTAIFRSRERATNHCSAGGFPALLMHRSMRIFGPLQGPGALLYAARRERLFRLFLGSSAVEHSTVNRMVAGSNPARGANKINHLAEKPRFPKNACVGTVSANQLPPSPPRGIEP
jgi:hypothetical protein